MFPAGGQASSSNMTSPIPPTRKKPVRSTSVGSFAALPTRRSLAWLSMAVRRWSRSAATASAATLPTPSTPRGTSSFISMALRAGWRSRFGLKGRDEARRKVFCRVRRVARTPGAATRGRRFVGLLLLLGPAMTHAGLTSTMLWLMLLLGAYHGLNPGMGWLFAVALGMQEQKGSAVARSLIPIAVGHAVAIGSVVLTSVFLGMTLPLIVIRYLVAALLVGMGIYCLMRHRHPRWVRMQVGFRDLTVWSFLMASAHGAGL